MLRSSIGFSPSILEAEKIASANFFTASLSDNSGNTCLAHLLPGYDTIFQLVSKLVIFSIAGLEAIDIALPTLETTSGFWPDNSIGLSPEIARRAVLLLKASAIPLKIQSGALSKLSSLPYLYFAKLNSSSDKIVVTTPAPALYASSVILLTRGNDSTVEVIIKSCPCCKFKPNLIHTLAILSSIFGSKGKSSSSVINSRLCSLYKLFISDISKY